jgi:hypothetical protein
MQLRSVGRLVTGKGVDRSLEVLKAVLPMPMDVLERRAAAAGELD